MFQRKPRRFRRRSNGRNHHPRGNGMERTEMGSSLLTNIRGRNNFKPYQSAEKLAEKYKILAKEALSKGDKTLSESFFQHADHYMRVISEKSLNQNQNKAQVSENQKTEDKNNSINQNKPPESKEEEKK